jgi:hypothetical protein
MRLIIIIFFIWIQEIDLFSQQTFNEKYGSAIIVLIEKDPWLMVIGSDVPTFALYEKGQIIYQQIVKRQVKYFELQLSRDSTQNLIQTFGITDSLMKNHPDYVEASYATDEPDNVLILNLDTLRRIQVYGNEKSKRGEQKTNLPIFSYGL